MKGITPDELKQFLAELHDDLEFEIFIALENKGNPQIQLMPTSVPALDPDIIAKYNQRKYGTWFTPNSMKNGKRRKIDTSRFNAIVLDMDFKGTVEEIAEQKAIKLKELLDLQLKPTVIVETRNGYHLYWFLVLGTIIDIEVFAALQILMQQKLDTDPGSLGAEHLFRVPGYNHWKVQDDPFMCQIIHADYTKRYTYDELVHKYGGKKKLEHLKRKSVMRDYSGKPIKLAAFNDKGDVNSIHEGCDIIAELSTKKDPSHIERLVLLWTYINLGLDGLEHFRELAKQWNDYDECAASDQFGSFDLNK